MIASGAQVVPWLVREPAPEWIVAKLIAPDPILKEEMIRVALPRLPRPVPQRPL